MIKKLFLLAIATLLFISCDDNSSDTNNDPTPIEISFNSGDKWELENSQGVKLEITYDEKKSVEWVGGFINHQSRQKSNIESYLFTFKFFDTNPAEIVDYAVAVYDSTVVWATRKHPMTNLNYQTEYYIPLVEFPIYYDDYTSDESEMYNKVWMHYLYRSQEFDYKGKMYKSISAEIDMVDSTKVPFIYYEDNLIFSNDLIFAKIGEFVLKNYSAKN